MAFNAVLFRCFKTKLEHAAIPMSGCCDTFCPVRVCDIEGAVVLSSLPCQIQMEYIKQASGAIEASLGVGGSTATAPC